MIKYLKEEFDGYTHRFIVRLKVDNDFRNDHSVNVYSNSESYSDLENFINEKKSSKVIAFVIEHRATKEQDEMASKFIDSFLNKI